jgi:hypothetical protein
MLLAVPWWRTMPSACCKFSTTGHAVWTRAVWIMFRALNVRSLILGVPSFCCIVTFVATLALTMAMTTPHTIRLNSFLAESRQQLSQKWDCQWRRSFGLELFNIPLCLAITQAWQRPQMPKRGRQIEFKQVLGKCLVFGSHMNSCVKNTLVYQSTFPLHRLKLPILRLRRQATECQAEGWTRAWRGMTFGHEFNQKLEGVKLPNNLPNPTFGRVYPIPCGIYKYNLPTYPHTHKIS